MSSLLEGKELAATYLLANKRRYTLPVTSFYPFIQLYCKAEKCYNYIVYMSRISGYPSTPFFVAPIASFIHVR